MVVNEIGEELDIANSTLSHHLDKLKNEDLVEVQREVLRYSPNTKPLAELLGFLYAECCTRNKAVEPQLQINHRLRRGKIERTLRKVAKERYGTAARTIPILMPCDKTVGRMAQQLVPTCHRALFCPELSFYFHQLTHIGVWSRSCNKNRQTVAD